MSHEQELIHRAQAGDQDAFCELARIYQRRIYAMALHFARDPHHAEDLAQEVWLKAYRSLATFREESGFYTWLRRIAVNTLINAHRNRLFRLFQPARELLSLDAVDSERHVEPVGHSRLLVQEVYKALSGLGPRERLIFILKHREGMTYDEIADVCGVSSGTVKKALNRVVGKLRRQMNVEPDSAGVNQLLTREES